VLDVHDNPHATDLRKAKRKFPVALYRGEWADEDTTQQFSRVTHGLNVLTKLLVVGFLITQG